MALESIRNYDRIISMVPDLVECEPCDSGACKDGWVSKLEDGNLVAVECGCNCHYPDRKPVYNEDQNDR